MLACLAVVLDSFGVEAKGRGTNRTRRPVGAIGFCRRFPDTLREGTRLWDTADAADRYARDLNKRLPMKYEKSSGAMK